MFSYWTAYVFLISKHQFLVILRADREDGGTDKTSTSRHTSRCVPWSLEGEFLEHARTHHAVLPQPPPSSLSPAETLTLLHVPSFSAHNCRLSQSLPRSLFTPLQKVLSGTVISLSFYCHFFQLVLSIFMSLTSRLTFNLPHICLLLFILVLLPVFTLHLYCDWVRLNTTSS